MLLIAEVKEIVPPRYGFKAVVKHVPDQAFALDEKLHRRLGRRFESALALWDAAEGIRMVIIAAFSVAAAGVQRIEELSLMPDPARLTLADSPQQVEQQRPVRFRRLTQRCPG